jgi:hypothetical protein
MMKKLLLLAFIAVACEAMAQEIYPGPNTGLGRIIETKQTVHIVDTRAEHVYAEADAWRRATADLGGIRSLLKGGLPPVMTRKRNNFYVRP